MVRKRVVAVTDPIAVGFSLEALIAVNVEGNLREVADALAAIEQATYVVITTGRYDIMCEVVCEDTDELLTLVNEVIRPTPGVTHAETFTYMHLTKQSYSWGTR